MWNSKSIWIPNLYANVILNWSEQFFDCEEMLTGFRYAYLREKCFKIIWMKQKTQFLHRKCILFLFQSFRFKWFNKAVGNFSIDFHYWSSCEQPQIRILINKMNWNQILFVCKRFNTNTPILGRWQLVLFKYGWSTVEYGEVETLVNCRIIIWFLETKAIRVYYIFACKSKESSKAYTDFEASSVFTRL